MIKIKIIRHYRLVFWTVTVNNRSTVRNRGTVSGGEAKPGGKTVPLLSLLVTVSRGAEADANALRSGTSSCRTRSSM